MDGGFRIQLEHTDVKRPVLRMRHEEIDTEELKGIWQCLDRQVSENQQGRRAYRVPGNALPNLIPV